MMEKQKPRIRSRNSPKPAHAPQTSTVEAAKALHVNPKPGADVDEAVADTIMRPGTAAARLVRAFNLHTVPEDTLTLRACIEEMNRQAGAIHAGDMKRPEAILITQAHALNAMFTNLAERAQQQTGIAQVQCLMGLALRSQAQCRSTLEALAEMKNPRPVAFVKQANIANGPQQVNNMEAGNNLPARTKENPTQSNELLEVNHGERLDIGTAVSTSSPDNPLAALGALHRA